ncbi:cellulose synthase-like protein D1 isoform X2 [Magnolia sinica]|uniref:cellulose synthase-like protein D1 isoform X2 n=1 Tax=Magnolia sinica TaxID=86752 RepID=UPI00265A845B|nr:cellulose synthase-like protein D1 isoform X2 [Magnolia sinica]
MVDKEQAKMPMLVYVSHEKKRSYPHHFKAGALNVLEERGRPLQWTNQVVDKKQAERYEKEIFDFQGGKAYATHVERGGERKKERSTKQKDAVTCYTFNNG